MMYFPAAMPVRVLHRQAGSRNRMKRARNPVACKDCMYIVGKAYVFAKAGEEILTLDNFDSAALPVRSPMNSRYRTKQAQQSRRLRALHVMCRLGLNFATASKEYRKCKDLGRGALPVSIHSNRMKQAKSPTSIACVMYREHLFATGQKSCREQMTSFPACL